MKVDEMGVREVVELEMEVGEVEVVGKRHYSGGD